MFTDMWMWWEVLYLDTLAALGGTCGNLLLSTNSQVPLSSPPGPSKVQSLNRPSAPWGMWLKFSFQLAKSLFSYEQTPPTQGLQRYGIFVLGEYFLEISRHFYGLSQFWRLCGWHLVWVLNTPYRQRAVPQQRILQPQTSIVPRSWKHLPQVECICSSLTPESWWSVFLYQTEYCCLFVRSVPSWHFPMQVPSTQDFSVFQGFLLWSLRNPLTFHTSNLLP